jgi:hypothetical protein
MDLLLDTAVGGVVQESFLLKAVCIFKDALSRIILNKIGFRPIHEREKQENTPQVR